MRTKLIDLGIKLFSEQGFHGTGLKEILQAGNVPKGSFYNYFDSKEAFAAEVIDVHSMRVLAMFDQILVERADDPPITRIRAFHDYLVELHELADWREGCLLGNLAAEFASSSELCSAALRRGVDDWCGRTAVLFAEGQERGEVRTDVSASALARQFWNSWQGALLTMQYERSGEALTNAIDLNLQTFVVASGAPVSA